MIVWNNFFNVFSLEWRSAVPWEWAAEPETEVLKAEELHQKPADRCEKQRQKETAGKET